VSEVQNDEVPCSPHPCAPHGFNRNQSHTEDRYVCDCEYWRPDRNCAAEQLQADHARRVGELDSALAQCRGLLADQLAATQSWRDKATAAETDAGRLRADATEAVEGLIALLKTAAVFGDFDGVNHNGRPAAEVISDVLAAESIAELRAALAAGVGGREG
jgi:hypothetical protein